ncbi:MAG: DNA polymerase, partial [Pygmaiobacter sp.]
GILVDEEGITQFGTELRRALDAELGEIYSMVGYEFNVNSPKQLGKALFEDLGLATRKKNKSGFSTNAETLEALREEHPVISHVLLYRTYQKLNSTYIEGLLKVIGEDGRIHSTFNQTETRTGRISSGEPNLQNIPVRTELGSRLRKYFVAPKGSILLDADYSQIELRILAAISEDEQMMAAFKAGEDIHRATASRIFGVPMELVTPQLRSRAKAVNFGIVYGIGAFSLAKDTGVSMHEADVFIKQYLKEYSGVKEYMEKTVAKGREDGFVTTLYGRRRPLPELAAANHNLRALGERMAMNTPIQGTAADIIKLAMIRVTRRLKSEGLSARLILQVHDELIVEAPLSEADAAAAILGEEMMRAATLSVALPAEVSRGRSWYEAKS